MNDPNLIFAGFKQVQTLAPTNDGGALGSYWAVLRDTRDNRDFRDSNLRLLNIADFSNGGVNLT